MSCHDLIGESRNIPFCMNSSAYKHIERMLFPENLDYPVKPDNDRKERNHVSSFYSSTIHGSLYLRHIFVLLSITFYPLDSTISQY
jgi:hypothetical protein